MNEGRGWAWVRGRSREMQLAQSQQQYGSARVKAVARVGGVEWTPLPGEGCALSVLSGSRVSVASSPFYNSLMK